MSIRWGIIGCGNVAEFKSGPPLYQTPGSELIAVMRRDAAKAADFAQRHGARRWYTDAEALIADTDVNAIYIASPHYLHAAHVKLAADAGKIVLVREAHGHQRCRGTSLRGCLSREPRAAGRGVLSTRVAHRAEDARVVEQRRDWACSLGANQSG